MGPIRPTPDHERGAGVNLPDEVDVLVAGFGAAGAAAAIAAHDAGASVAIVEKTTSGGGNCVYSGGFLFDVDGPHAVDHLDALCFGKTERTVLEAYARGLRDVPGFVEALGGSVARVDLEAFGGTLPSARTSPAPDTLAIASSCRNRASAPAPACGACSRGACTSATSLCC